MVQSVTLNMCMHTHLCESVLDFSPTYAFWLFSVTRYNGLMGSFQRNNWSNELQFMRKFLRDQTVQEVAFPDSFQSDFGPLFRCTNQLGRLGETEFKPVQSFHPLASLCYGSVESTHLWNEISVYHYLPPSSLESVISRKCTRR